MLGSTTNFAAMIAASAERADDNQKKANVPNNQALATLLDRVRGGNHKVISATGIVAGESKLPYSDNAENLETMGK